MTSSLAFTSLQRANRVKSLMVGLAMLTEIFHLGAFVSQLLVVGCGAFSTQSTSTAFYQKHDRSLLFRLKSVGNTHGMDSDPKAMLKDMNQRLEILQTSSPAALSTFFEPALLSFSVKPGSTERMSITSTCYALRAIQATDDRETVFNSLLAMDARIGQVEPGDPRTPVQSILKALLDSEYWRTDDLFQVPLLLHTLLSVDKDRVILSSKGMDEATANRIRQLLTAILGARPRRRDGNEKALSDYIIFELTKVYALLYEVDDIVHGQDRGNDLNTEEMASDDMLDEDQGSTLAGLRPSVVPDGFRSQLPLALSRCAESSSNELSRQVALHFAGDSNNFDIMKLAYSLLTYVVSTKTLEGSAGRELVRGQGPSQGTRVQPVNKRMVKAALKVFFDEQQESGLWDKGQPIYRSFRRAGKNVGNAFVFSIDTLCSLLEELPADDFAQYLPNLERALTWMESHQSVEILPDYCDPFTGQCYGKSIRGWSSPHLSPDGGPLAWSTAQVVSCVSRLKSVVETIRHEKVLQEFRGIRLSSNGPSSTAWDRLLDSDLGSVGPDGEVCTLKDVLESRMLKSRLPASEDDTLPSLVSSTSYSAILFGPPGTAKTTICEALAQRIGWDFVVIDTSVFLEDGLSNVASRIRYVFEQLQSLRRTVILFDEIEEFCLDREAPGIGMESRMLTTAMLTAINDLRRAKRSMFFLATNRLRAFDAAIIRPGRFDMQIFVGTPNQEARWLQFKSKLADVPVSTEEKESAMLMYKLFLATVWSEAKYMNYLEGVQFASQCASLLAQKKLTTENMESVFKSQAAVMTVRGQVRDEFDASMSLSRL